MRRSQAYWNSYSGPSRNLSQNFQGEQVMMKSTENNMKREMAEVEQQTTYPKVVECLREFVDHLVSHASLGLNEEEVGMLRRAETVLKKLETLKQQISELS